MERARLRNKEAFPNIGLSGGLNTRENNVAAKSRIEIMDAYFFIYTSNLFLIFLRLSFQSTCEFSINMEGKRKH